MTDAVLITGGSGLLALNWAAALRDRVSVTLALYDRAVTLANVSTQWARLDSADEILLALDAIQPAMVVHTAGLANVEACEADEGLAHHVNVDIAGYVAVACARRGLPLVHVSSDHLFRGDEALVAEAQPLAPQNAYGRTKADAEQRVLDAHPDALVVRTNFYGWGPRYRRSFSDTIIDALRKGDPITLFTDVFYTPILAETLSLAVDDMVRLKISGVVHVSGDERLSKYDFGLRVAQRFSFDASLIRPGLLAGRLALVRRPLDMSLSNAHACRLLGRRLGGVDEHLARLYQQEQLGLAQEVQNA
jgi:dTDP-4-dehydrorhamnose reductase